jgi:hypothetical protein
LGRDTDQSGSQPPAGTITSFTDGVLTITLNDGSTVSGKVTDATEIHCQAAQPTEMQNDELSSGDDSGDQSGDQGDGSDDQGDGSDDQGEDQGEQMCGPSALAPRAAVQDAVLGISSAGAIWDNVDLGTGTESDS